MTARPTLETWGDTRTEGKIARAMGAYADQAETLAEVYTPGDSTLWASPAPTTQDEALNRLAAAVAGLLAGTIP